MPLSPDDDNLTRLIYFSRLALRYDADVNAVIDDILRVSELRNTQAGVSGLLLIHDGWFVQALEGPAGAVKTTYDRISADRRHIHQVQIIRGPVKSRCFGQWSMCARQGSPTDAAIIETLSSRGLFNPLRLNGDEALRLLRTVGGIKARSMSDAPLNSARLRDRRQSSRYI